MFFKSIVLISFSVLLLHLAHCQVSSSTAAPDIELDNFPNATTVAEALNYSNIVLGIVDNFIQMNLPSAILKEGASIRSGTQLGLEYCEQNLKTPADIQQYKGCCSAVLKNSMATLGSLKGQYYATSGASRLKLFW